MEMPSLCLVSVLGIQRREGKALWITHASTAISINADLEKGNNHIRGVADAREDTRDGLPKKVPRYARE